MGCQSCDFTGVAEEYEPETGFVDIPCPECIGVDGEEPDLVTEGHDVLTEEDMETQVCLGLNAAGFLLLAQGHLGTALARVGDTEQPTRDYMAGEAIVRATLAARHAMKLLKEEPCKES